MISTRHIRHDWKTFVEWEQVSVRTVCGVTTRRHLAGIPGVTPQAAVVEIGGRKKWGWCMRCTVYTHRETVEILKSGVYLPEGIWLRYVTTRDSLHEQASSFLGKYNSTPA